MDNPTTRERKTDAVAKSMGELLLKGYRMMSTSCQVCYVSLVRKKNITFNDKHALGGVAFRMCCFKINKGK